jgi:hypothetical protein
MKNTSLRSQIFKCFSSSPKIPPGWSFKSKCNLISGEIVLISLDQFVNTRISFLSSRNTSRVDFWLDSSLWSKTDKLFSNLLNAYWTDYPFYIYFSNHIHTLINFLHHSMLMVFSLNFTKPKIFLFPSWFSFNLDPSHL